MCVFEQVLLSSCTSEPLQHEGGMFSVFSAAVLAYLIGLWKNLEGFSELLSRIFSIRTSYRTYSLCTSARTTSLANHPFKKLRGG